MSIKTRREEGILHLVIDRPKARNALTLEMGKRLCDAFLAFREDPELRVATLTGAGDKAFCAGADLREVGPWYASMTSIERRERAEREPGLGGITRNLDPGKPVIAAINGPCLAGGLEIALACDIRIAVPHATFGLPEVKWGIMPGAGGTQRLSRTVPFGMALEMMLTGDPIDAETALRHGLISHIVAKDDLMAEAGRLARRIALNGPLAVRAVRQAARRGRDLPLSEALRLEQFYAEPLRQSEDAKEGLRAFSEKRTPRFQGK